MGLVTKYHTWVDGALPAGLINAVRLNTNFDTLYTLVNGNLDSANLANPLPFTQNVLFNGGAILKFTETGGGTDYVALGAPSSVATSFTLKLPIADGTNGQVLQTDGSGQLGWVSVATGPPTDHGTLAGLTDDDHTIYSKYAFKTIAVSGQSDVVADTRDDTLTLAAGTNITITTVAGTDTVTIAGSTSIPSGVICMWHGLIANIPAGWVLCNGSNGTPDLRSKFVKGAADGVEAGATGGAATHVHDDHGTLSHTVTQPSAHTLTNNHTVTQPTAHGTSKATYDAGGVSVLTPTNNHAGSAVAAHVISAHTGTAVSNHTSGQLDHSTESNEPAFYTILYIMKT